MTKASRLDVLRRSLARLCHEAEPPAYLIEAAVALHRQAPAAEIFLLRAAASGGTQEGLVCTSQSGLWMLEIFVGQSEADRSEGRGQVLLSVHPDHRATYEGRTARIFVAGPEGERVLAEAPVEGGELCADITLAGLDLQHRDAINVVFGGTAQP